MNHTKYLSFWATCALALVLAGCAGTAGPKSETATSEDSRRVGYVVDGMDKKVVRSGLGECVRATGGARDVATECEPQKAAAAPVQEPEQPIAEAAAPAEAVVEAPPQPVFERVFVATDAYFGFNEATLQPEARAKLDNIIVRVKEASEPSVQITAYADPIGSEQYNMELSQRRADAVRTYLIDQGVPNDVIAIEARGESAPVVKCEGKQGQELIECLQPDRVSEVIVSVVEEVEAR